MSRPLSARYNIYEAKTRLSELVKKAREGKDVVIMVRGKPAAKVIAYDSPPKEKKLGFAKGKIEILPGFDDVPEGFEDYV